MVSAFISSAGILPRDHFMGHIQKRFHGEMVHLTGSNASDGSEPTNIDTAHATEGPAQSPIHSNEHRCHSFIAVGQVDNNIMLCLITLPRVLTISRARIVCLFVSPRHTLEIFRWV